MTRTAELAQRLMRRVRSAVWNYISFQNWTWFEPADAALLRASWPTWRKAVRPLGASVFWAMIIGAGIAHHIESHPTIASGHGIYLAGIAIVAACVGYVIVDGFRTRRRLRSRMDLRRPAAASR